MLKSALKLIYKSNLCIYPLWDYHPRAHSNMVYKLGNLLEDCAKIRWRRKADATPKEKLVILKNVWRAVNGWILERLETGKVRLSE